MKTNSELIQQIEFQGDALIIHGRSNHVKIMLEEISTKLLNANSTERTTFQISPSGIGVHWPLIDEDLSFPNLYPSTLFPSLPIQ
jgi:hypothetical protein